jgi:hypothetical protein
MLGLWLVSALGLGLFLYQRDVEQRERLERLDQQLAGLHKALTELKRAPAPGSPLTPTPLPPEAPRGGVDLVATEALAQRVAELVGEQLRANPVASKAAPEPKKEPAPPPSREQQAAVERAQQTLEGAISRGRLSREDVQEMGRQLALAHDVEAHHELNRRILQAINTNKLIPEDPRFIIP